MEMERECMVRRTFLCLGISLTLLGCLITIAGIAMPGWQILDLPELNAVHEHAIFYDCVLSEVTPLDALRRTRGIPLIPPIRRNQRDVSLPIRPSRRCTYKFAASPWETQYVRMAIEEGDFAAKEHLNYHRFLPQHKAVIFFCVFTTIFALLSMVVGACSSCFVPNGILHVISIGLATTCSLLADIFFFMASQRDENRRVQGAIGHYQQHLSYAFFIHCLGSLTLVMALLCSGVACYLLLAREFRRMHWMRKKRGGKSENSMEEDSEKLEKCLFLSDVLNRPRMDTITSMEDPRLLPPPPPTPQQFQTQQLRLSGHSTIGGYRQRGGSERSSAKSKLPRNSTCSVRSLLTSSKDSGPSSCSAV